MSSRGILLIRLFGQVIDVKIIRKNTSGLAFKDNNYGFVQMKNVHEADNALLHFKQISDKNWVISTYNDKSK